MMTKTVSIIIATCLAIGVAHAALTFADGSSDRVNHGSASMFDNMTVGTMIVWFYPETFANNHSIVGKFSSAANSVNMREIDANGNFGIRVGRATTALEANSSNNPLTQNGWNFIAVTWDVNGVDGDQKAYHGNLTTTAAEVTYGTQTVGSGTQGDDSAVDIAVGNVGAGIGVTACAGRIFVAGIWDRILTTEEIIAQQHFPHKTSGCILLTYPGSNGTDTTPDLSGDGNNGTVTGATVSDNPPIGATW